MKALKRLPLGSLTDRPDHELVGVLRMPELTVSPLRAIVKRIIGALLALLATVVIVYVDRDGYRDANGDGLSLLDSLYYATVSLSTTGYGDIAPATSSARLVNVLVITPLRVLFFIVLVGTTLEVLTARSRQAFKIQKWRTKVRDHTVVVGFGTKGRSAVNALLGDENLAPGQFVVVVSDLQSFDAASALGLVSVHGSATRSVGRRGAAGRRARAGGG